MERRRRAKIAVEVKESANPKAFKIHSSPCEKIDVADYTAVKKVTDCLPAEKVSVACETESIHSKDSSVVAVDSEDSEESIKVLESVQDSPQGAKKAKKSKVLKSFTEPQNISKKDLDEALESAINNAQPGFWSNFGQNLVNALFAREQ